MHEIYTTLIWFQHWLVWYMYVHDHATSLSHLNVCLIMTQDPLWSKHVVYLIKWRLSEMAIYVFIDLNSHQVAVSKITCLVYCVFVPQLPWWTFLLSFIKFVQLWHRQHEKFICLQNLSQNGFTQNFSCQYACEGAEKLLKAGMCSSDWRHWPCAWWQHS